MPDWTYRTLIQPVLLRFPPEAARGWALSALARLARCPGGSAVLEFFGHMRADPRLAVSVAGAALPGPVGIGAALDPTGVALGALSRFGVGFVEVGPVGGAGSGPIAGLSAADGTIRESLGTRSPESMIAQLERWRDIPVPVWIRLAEPSAASLVRVVEKLEAHADGWVVEWTESDDAARIAAVVRAYPGKPVWIAFTMEQAETVVPEAVWGTALGAGACGVWLLAERNEVSGRVRGCTDFRSHVARVRRFRTALGPGGALVAGGAQSPADALRLRSAGADLVSLDVGLVFSGPGLPKRVNEALLWQRCAGEGVGTDPAPATARSWLWFLLMGLGMLWGGALALGIACTRVVLPYDEVFCGMDRVQLAAVNSRLLSFMAHDRVTLAGTMVTSGILYSGLAWFGLRRGDHWVKMAVAVSALAGFSSFFLFLGFGYFDPFHAFVSAILFQFLLLGLHSPEAPWSPRPHPELLNSPAWQRGQWGQLLFVLLGVGLVGAGCVISGVGITSVFVADDLEYLRTTTGALQVANPRLIPLVAHDRASLGGMLVACGLAVWLTAQWGFRAGERWLWWTLLLGGLPAFAAAIGVHVWVGYLSVRHLAPAVMGLVWFGAALMLSHAWLTEPDCVRRRQWDAVKSPG